jgi:hypothetical protein
MYSAENPDSNALLLNFLSLYSIRVSELLLSIVARGDTILFLQWSLKNVVTIV